MGGTDVEKTVRKHVLLVVENAPVPVDRRVWGEAMTLKRSGYDVSVISPQLPQAGSARQETIEGIDIWRFAMPFGGSNKRDFVFEYAWAFVACHLLALRVWRRKPFQVIHVANPPDLFFGLKWLFGWRGIRFIFDQHDLAPELYESKFDEKGSNFIRAALRWLERQTYRAADVVLVTNESYRQRAVSLGHVRDEEIFTVRNSPNKNVFYPREPSIELRKGYQYLVLFAGTMGHQDGVDVLLKAAHHVRTERRRHDVLFVLAGTGDAWEELQQIHRDYKLGDGVRFTGFLDDQEMLAYLSTADIGSAPDLAGPLNSVSTMVKTLEYMAMGLPVVSFDLEESRFSADDAAVYVQDQTPEAFGDAIIELLDNPEKRKHMSEVGQARIAGPLSWKHSTENLLAAYESVLSNG